MRRSALVRLYQAIVRLLIKTWCHRLPLDFSWKAAGRIATASSTYGKAHLQTEAVNSATTCVVMWQTGSDISSDDNLTYETQPWANFLKFEWLKVSKIHLFENYCCVEFTHSCNSTGKSRILDVNLFPTLFSTFTKKKRDLLQENLLAFQNHDWTIIEQWLIGSR